MNAIQKASAAAGGQCRLAAAIGVTPAAVNQWITGKRPIPAERCIDIERATAGAVTCEALRPDLAARWSFLRGTAKNREAA